jgi:hypothetical protein
VSKKGLKIHKLELFNYEITKNYRNLNRKKRMNNEFMSLQHNFIYNHNEEFLDNKFFPEFKNKWGESLN